MVIVGDWSWSSTAFGYQNQNLFYVRLVLSDMDIPTIVWYVISRDIS